MGRIVGEWCAISGVSGGVASHVERILEGPRRAVGAFLTGGVGET